MSRFRSAAAALLVALLAGMRPLAVAAQAQRVAEPPSLPEVLAGTAWQLLEIRSPEGDLESVRPNDPALYTMALAEDGTVSMRLDCNRASGTWTASTAGASFGFGPIRMTRVVCQQPSLDLQIARDTEFVSAYRVRDGLLYLSLVADGGLYIWERVRE
jgi:heat shock protein HslJ